MADIKIGDVRAAWETLDVRGIYWISTSIGACFYRGDSTDFTLRMARTINGGVSWTETDIIPSVPFVSFFDCWFDIQTPGYSGTIIHIAYLDADNDEARYLTVDLSDATVSSIDVITTIDVDGVSANNRIYLTQTRNGNLVTTFQSANANLTYKSTNGGTSWSSIALLMEASSVDDAIRMFPANTGDDSDVCALFMDFSANTLSIKMYDDSANTWTETSVSAAYANVSSTDDRVLDASLRISDGHIIAVANNRQNDSLHDMNSYDINPNSISSVPFIEKAEVITNSDTHGGCGIIIDQNTDDVYICYLKGGTWATALDVYYRKSTDDLTSWGTEQSYSEGNTDLRKPTGGKTIGSGGGRISFMFGTAGTDDIQTNLVNDIEIASSGAVLVIQDSSHSHLSDNLVITYNPVTSEQEGFRFRNDDGNEANATWRATQDSNITQPISTTTRLRFLLDMTGNPSSQTITLQYKRKDEASDQWRKI